MNKIILFQMLAVSFTFIFILITCGSDEEDPYETIESDDDDDPFPGNDDDDDDNNDNDDNDTDSCVIPYSGMKIVQDTVLCPSDTPYDLPEAKAVGAIRIAKSGITISGYGVTIIGDGDGTGIYFELEEPTDITIEGITVKDYYYGISSSGNCENLLLSEITVENSGDYHIAIGAYNMGNPNYNVHMKDLVVRNSKNTGVFCNDCFDSIIEDCESYNDRYDVIESNFVLSGGGNNIVRNNTVITSNSSGCNAIWLYDTNDNLIQGNYLELGFKDGSHTHGASNNIYTDNEFHMTTTGQAVIWPDSMEKATECRCYSQWFKTKSKGSTPSEDNLFYGNIFDLGHVHDRGVNSQFCKDGVGNQYLNGAFYDGDDPNGGLCP